MERRRKPSAIGQPSAVGQSRARLQPVDAPKRRPEEVDAALAARDEVLTREDGHAGRALELRQRPDVVGEEHVLDPLDVVLLLLQPLRDEVGHLLLILDDQKLIGVGA